MSEKTLSGKRVLAIVGPDYEDLELWYPVLRLREAGAEVFVAGPNSETDYAGKHGYPARSEGAIGDQRAEDFDALIVPGGWMPDKLRRDHSLLELVRAFHAQEKLIAQICHGGSILISAGILRGTRGTSSRGIKDDMENAGVEWIDEPVVVDRNLISSRTPPDLPEFGAAIVDWLAEH